MRNDAMRFVFFLSALLIAAAFWGGRSLDQPGLYYDEAVQARPALEFLSGKVNASPLPGSQTRWVGAHPLPVMTQPYMGALKSQVLAAPLWLFGARVEVLRATTLVLALLGVAVCAIWARRVFGTAVSLLGTALLVLDPSFLLLARHDWGSFSLSLLLRAIVLLAGWRFFESRRPAALCIAALALGLGFYNKIDFAIFAAAAGAALLCCAGKPTWRVLRERPALLVAALGSFLLGLGPLLANLSTIASRPGAFAKPGEAGEKLQTLFTLLDGSHFHRLMETGGLFDRIGNVENAPAGPFAALLLGALVFVALRWLRRRGAPTPSVRGELFLWLATVFSVAAFFALPGGVRIHHALNIVPFPQFLVAAALLDLASLGGTPRGRQFARGFAILVFAFVLLLQVMVFEHTRRAFAASGGKGRWSGAIAELARDLRGTPMEVWSLDWGFHEPLAFLGAGERLHEVHWQIPSMQRRLGAFRARGEANRIYVLHLPPYDRSGYGLDFLEAVKANDPERSEIVTYRDGDGDVAFLTVRILGPHAIYYDGRFAIDTVGSP